MSTIVSRIVPIPNSSSVPGSFSADTSSITDRRSCSLLSSQLSVDVNTIDVICQGHTGRSHQDTETNNDYPSAKVDSQCRVL